MTKWVKGKYAAIDVCICADFERAQVCGDTFSLGVDLDNELKPIGVHHCGAVWS